MYRRYFTAKWEKESFNILQNSHSLEEADGKLREKMEKFDQAWDQVAKFYHVDEENE